MNYNNIYLYIFFKNFFNFIHEWNFLFRFNSLRSSNFCWSLLQSCQLLASHSLHCALAWSQVVLYDGVRGKFRTENRFFFSFHLYWKIRNIFESLIVGCHCIVFQGFFNCFKFTFFPYLFVVVIYFVVVLYKANNIHASFEIFELLKSSFFYSKLTNLHLRIISTFQYYDNPDKAEDFKVETLNRMVTGAKTIGVPYFSSREGKAELLFLCIFFFQL